MNNNDVFHINSDIEINPPPQQQHQSQQQQFEDQDEPYQHEDQAPQGKEQQGTDATKGTAEGTIAVRLQVETLPQYQDAEDDYHLEEEANENMDIFGHFLAYEGEGKDTNVNETCNFKF